MWPLSPLINRSIIESGSFVCKLFPSSPNFISVKSFQRCFKSKKTTNYTWNNVPQPTDNQKLFNVAISGGSLTKTKSSNDKHNNEHQSISKSLLSDSGLAHNSYKFENLNELEARLGKNDRSFRYDEGSTDSLPQIDEKFRLYLLGKSPSQIVDKLRANRHLIDLVRLRTFIKQLSYISPIYEYHLSPEQLNFIYEMLTTFPEMTSDLSNLSDISCLVSQIRIDSKTPLLQYITREVIKKIDEMTFNQAFEFYKSLQVIRTPVKDESSSLPDRFDLFDDNVLRARYLLISNIAFRIETHHFDETDIISLCEVFRRINKELYAKEAIDVLVKSIVTMSCYMKSKNSTDIIAGFTTINGSKILKEVFSSGDEIEMKRYRDLIEISLRTTGRLTNTAIKPNPECTQYISDCFIRILLKEGENFNQPSFWSNFLGEIDFNRHKLDLHSWQNLLTLINRFRIYCPFIIDTIGPIVLQNAQTFIQDRQISPIPYIRLMAECYHKPLTVNWNKFLSILLHPKKLTEVPIDRSLSLLSRLAILEDYSRIRDFDLDLLKLSLNTFKNPPQSKRLLTFYSGLIHESDNPQKWVFKKEFAPFVSRSIFSLNKYLRTGPISSLQNILETSFGGPEFVIHGVWSKAGVFMNHVLVFRRGEYPVAIRNVESESEIDQKLTFFHEISIPSEAKVVTIIPAYKYYYSNHSTSLRGKVQFKLRLLRKIGILPVLVDIPEFESLSAYERTHWLVNKIRKKIMEDNSNAWEFWR